MRPPIRVLFVEDDPDMTAIYNENFLEPEFETATATNGEEAIRVLRAMATPFDVIVTDNYMPEMDGMALLKTIHFEFPSVKLVMVTGFGNWSDYIEAHNLGVCKFFDKPVKMSELKGIIRSL